MKGDQSKVDPLEQSFLILESLGFDEAEYYMAVDVLSKNENAKTFMALPETRRKPFLINKMKF